MPPQIMSIFFNTEQFMQYGKESFLLIFPYTESSVFMVIRKKTRWQDQLQEILTGHGLQPKRGTILKV